jgi:3-phytase
MHRSVKRITIGLLCALVALVGLGPIQAAWAATPTFVGKTSASNAATSLAVAAPTGVQTGDLQVAVVAIATSSESIATAPTGWTLRGSHSASTLSDTFRVYVYTSTTATGSTTFTKSGSRSWQIARLAYSGVNSASAASLSLSDDDTTASTPSVTPTANDALVIGGAVTDGTDSAGPSWTSPSGWTERYDEKLTAELVTITAAEKAVATPAATSGTFTQSVADDAIVYSMVLESPQTNNPPDTFIAVEEGPYDKTINADISSSDPAATRECRLDGGAWFSCGQYNSTTVTDGSHTLEARSTNAGGTDPTPATYTWVDPVTPNVTITSEPAASTTSTSASFSFSSTTSGATFQCMLDGTDFLADATACTSPKTYSGLAAGTHTFSVRAIYNDPNSPIDGEGTPDSSTWTITTTTPPPSGGPSGPSGNWTMEFNDEFNGTSLDLSKWESSWFNGGSMNNVTTSPSNVTVANGEAQLQLSSSSSGSLIHTGGGTNGDPTRYGMEVGDVIEARMWFPGNGTDLFNWPAFWANDTYDGVSGQPVCGEYDIAEVLSDHDMTVNYHSPSGDYNQGAVAGYWGDAWHTFTLHRKASSADVYYDGQLVESFATDDNDCPIDVIFNNGRLSTTTTGVSPVTGSAGALRIDWVRAYEPDGGTPPPPSGGTSSGLPASGSSVQPTHETANWTGGPYTYSSGDVTDDSVIYADPNTPGNSVVIADNKSDGSGSSAGGVGVFSMSGSLLQFRQGEGQIGNIDYRPFTMGGSEKILVGANRRDNNTMRFWVYDPATRTLGANVNATTLPATDSLNYGFCMGYTSGGANLNAYVLHENGVMKQYRITESTSEPGKVTGTLVRTFDVGGISEGCAVDDELGYLYIGEEDTGLWRYGAGSTTGSTRTSVASVSGSLLNADVEGISIAKLANNTGYIYVSSQADNQIVVFDRVTNAHVRTFSVGSNGTIDAVTDTDGVAVETKNLGSNYPYGALVVHDNSNTGGSTSNLKYVPLVEAATPPPPSGDGTTAASTFNWGSVIAGDEFNYTGAADSTKWNVYDSAGHAGNGVRSPDQVSVNGSALQILGLSNGTTGGMSAKFGHRTYGKWETRMRVSARDSEYHPVLIVWPEGGRTSATSCSEIDYAESTSSTDRVKFFLHHDCNGGQTTAEKVLDMTQWHNYAVEWTATKITGYVDGVKFYENTNTSQIPDWNHYQTIQLDWFPDGTSTTQSWLQVDWVRLYN